MRRRLMRMAASWVLVALGVSLLVRAELGVAPFDVLNSGINDRTGLAFGYCFVLSGMAFFLAGRLLGGRVGWASLAGSVTIGPMINLILSVLTHQEKLAVRVPFLVVGIVLVGIGICFGIASNLGPGPSEVFMLGLVRHGVGVVVARWVSDLLPIVVGAALGGAVGIGTVVFLVGMGPLVKVGLRLLRYEPDHRPGDPAPVDVAPTTRG
jgi:uncharacterized membrane protein YczE